MFLLAEKISVEEADHCVETDEDDEVHPSSLVHTSPPHKQQPEKSSELSSTEDMLYVGNRHAILAMVKTQLRDAHYLVCFALHLVVACLMF